MGNLLNLDAETGAGLVSDDGVTFQSSATASPAVEFSRTVVSSPTVAVVRLSTNSTASAPVFELSNQAFVSATTILFTTGATAGTGAIRVKIANDYKWIPVLVDGSVTAAAR